MNSPTQPLSKINPSYSQCPLCKKDTVHEFRPFCSARCKQVDLGKWFTEQYVIPGESLEEIVPETFHETESDNLR